MKTERWKDHGKNIKWTKSVRENTGKERKKNHRNVKMDINPSSIGAVSVRGPHS